MMKPQTETPKKFVAPSNIFERAFSSNSAGCVRECECGTTYFDIVNDYTWDDGELEGLCANEVKEPDKYHSLNHSVSTICLEGKEYVMGCLKCERPGQVEKWLISNARQIACFLNLRADELKQEAEDTRVKAGDAL